MQIVYGEFVAIKSLSNRRLETVPTSKVHVPRAFYSLSLLRHSKCSFNVNNIFVFFVRFTRGCFDADLVVARNSQSSLLNGKTAKLNLGPYHDVRHR